MRHFFYSPLTCLRWSTYVQSWPLLLDKSADNFNSSSLLLTTPTANNHRKNFQFVAAMICLMLQLYSCISLTTFVLILSAFAFSLVLLTRNRRNSHEDHVEPCPDKDSLEKQYSTKKQPPPGPSPWPIYGSLHLLGVDKNPWEAFKRLKEKYGDIYKINLGRRECIVVSSMDAIKEVLIDKSSAFSSRPNFLRYHALFGGNRENSLALCDWSDLQRTRRRLATPYVFPRANVLRHFEDVVSSEIDVYMNKLNGLCNTNNSTKFDKSHFSAVCANIFFHYFCSKRYSYNDGYFLSMIKRFDDIFHDINNGFAIDFLPWLAPFKVFHLSKLYYYGQYIRKFILKTVVNERMEDLANANIADDQSRDFLDVILRPFNNNDDKDGKTNVALSNDEALYELEDLLGGHSAVSCFWTRILAQIIGREDVKSKIREEMEAIKEPIKLEHRSQMPYTQAVIWETLRVTTSPIVPHVATQDETIGGFHVNKGSMIFINNYYLNLSESYWTDPRKFNPNRFISETGELKKPCHFLPFSTGQRSCLGYQILQSIVFLATIKLLQNFDINYIDSDETHGQSNEFSKTIEIAKLSVYDSDVKAVIRPRNNLRA
ncbi:hypothetical protein CHUAL_002068 [Chamberlinius hualienensis]